jgi:hypothetical protein
MILLALGKACRRIRKRPTRCERSHLREGDVHPVTAKAKMEPAAMRFQQVSDTTSSIGPRKEKRTMTSCSNTTSRIFRWVASVGPEPPQDVSSDSQSTVSDASEQLS